MSSMKESTNTSAN